MGYHRQVIDHPIESLAMTRGLERIYGRGHMHFITTSCFRRLPRLGAAKLRDVFLATLEQARRRFQFVVIGYVVMPEHVHLLISETGLVNPSVAMKWIKFRIARHCDVPDGGRFWQHRFYDFNVFTERKRNEKLDYMHLNPVRRGLVERPEDWNWSSFRFYAFHESGPVKIDEGWPEAKLRFSHTSRPGATKV